MAVSVTIYPNLLPASMLGEKSCNHCGKCCMDNPCRVVPDDVPRIAKKLRMSERTLAVKKLQLAVDASGYVVSPKRGNNGACIFWNGRCSIHKEKPLGGRHFECWNPAAEYDYSWTKSEIAKVWGSSPNA